MALLRRKSKAGWLLFALLASSVWTAAAAGGETPRKSWDRLRSEALNRPRRIIVNHDGCDMTEFPKDLPLTEENIYRRMFDRLKGTEVDTVCFCPFGVGHVLATRSRVTEIHTGKSASPATRNLTPELLKLGTDTLEVAVKFCRKNRFEIFASMRVNDMHDQWHPWLSPLKTEHPDWIFGTRERPPLYGAWTGFDFAVPETRARFRAIVAELLTNYDVDGIDLDFYRFPVLFRSVAWGGRASAEEVEMMTRLMRDIRQDALAIGRNKGRYLLISARLPDSPELGRAIGMDWEGWMRENLFDLYIPGGDFGRFSTYADSAALGRRYGIKVYPSVDTSWVKARGRFSRNDIAAYHAQSAAALAAGCDGLYYFNMFYAPGYLQQMHRDPKRYAGYNRRYFANYQNVYRFCREQHDFDPLLSGRGYGMLATGEGTPAVAMMELADDFTSPDVMARRPVITLRVSAPPAGREALEASVNGHRLDAVRPEKGEYAFAVAPSLLKTGPNYFTFQLSREDAAAMPAAMILAGGEPAGAPWRRLWADDAGGEEIVDGACRISDWKSGENAFFNLYFPLPNLAGKRWGGAFDLMVEKSDAPEAVALRLANGEQMDLVTFEPERIGLKYAGKSVAVSTAGQFRSYRFEVAGDRIRLWQENRLLLDEKPGMGAHDPAGYPRGNRAAFPLMDNRSLAIGSFSGNGTGAARWKNFRLTLGGLPLEDVALEVRFAPEVPAGLAAAAARPQPESLCGDAAAGIAGFRQFHHTYRTESIRVEDGALRLDHNHPEQRFANFSFRGGELQADRGILSVEWCIAPGEAETPADSSFQMVIQPAAGEGRVYNGIFHFAPGRAETSLGAVETPKSGFFTCRALIDSATGDALLLIDGRPAAGGRLAAGEGTARMFFGDGSGGIAGSAAVRYVKLGRMEEK